MSKPEKYVGEFDISEGYVDYLETKIKKVDDILAMTKEWIQDQDNGLTDSVICVAAMKDIRRIMRG